MDPESDFYMAVSDVSTADFDAPIHQVLAISVDIRRPPGAGRTTPKRFFLALGSELLIGMVEAALRSGFTANVHFSKRLAKSGASSELCPTANNFAAVIRRLQSSDDAGHLDSYPVSVWLLPAGDGEVAAAIEYARSVPSDDAAFLGALRKGAVRLAVTDAYLDVLAGAATGAMVLDWLRAGIAVSPVRVEWEARAS